MRSNWRTKNFKIRGPEAKQANKVITSDISLTTCIESDENQSNGESQIVNTWSSTTFRKENNEKFTLGRAKLIKTV